MTTTDVTIHEAGTTADRPLLEIRDLAISFKTGSGEVQAVRNAHLTIMPGETVANVGESGSGKSTTALAAIGLLRPRELASVAGVRSSADASLPVLVRLNAARQAVLGLALLTRTPTDVGRSAGLFLPLTTLDAAAVLLGVRARVLAPRSAVMALTVLGVNVAVAQAAGPPAMPRSSRWRR